jgi:hypothetical protein
VAFKPASLILDNATGYFELAIDKQVGDSPKGEWGLQWGPITGLWRRDVRVLRQIAQKHGILVGVAGHLEPKFFYETVGKDNNGKPIKDKRIVGWKLAIPGQGQERLLVPFDEVYHLVAQSNDFGNNPPRKLFTNPHRLHEYHFEAKSRFGVKGPLTNPTYASIIDALPRKDILPQLFMIVGEPGVGKTTLLNTFPKPALFIDIQGGCALVASDDTKVITPSDIDDVFNILRTIRDKGEI